MSAAGDREQGINETRESSHLRHIRNALIGLLLIAITAAAVIGKEFLVPVAFAFFLALTFRPFIRRMSKRGMPAWVTTTGIALALAVLLLVIAAVFGSAMTDWINRWPEVQRTFLQRNASLLEWFKHILDVSQTIAAPATEGGTATTPEVVVRQPVLPTIANFIATYPVNVTITLSSALVIALFLMASGDLFYEKLIRVMPRLDDKKNALRIVFDVERDVSSYLLTITAINAGLGAIVGVSFWLIGMPMPHFWAFLVFALNFIPYLGPIAGVIISGFVSIMVFSNWGQAVLAPAVYMTIIGIETQIVTPAVLSRRMSINSVAILIALAFWSWAWGIAGIIMAVPFLVTLRVFCSHLPVLNPVGEFLSGQGDNANEASANANVAKNPS